VLAVELANRESQSSWKEFCLGLKGRGLNGVELVTSDDHAGLRKAAAEVSVAALLCTLGVDIPSCVIGWKGILRKL
jgi:transposase-like protein